MNREETRFYAGFELLIVVLVKIRSSWMLHRVLLWMVTDVSKQCSVFFFRSKQSKHSRCIWRAVTV